MTRWQPGDTVVLRYHARDRDVISGGIPMTCVEDSEERLILFLPHGTSYLGHPDLPLEGRAHLVGDRLTNPLPP